MNFVIALLVLALIIVIYFLPSIIAGKNKKTNAGAIFALNLLAGWTGVGYIIALIWALCKDKK